MSDQPFFIEDFDENVSVDESTADFNRLKELLEQLENEDISLEEAFKAYSEGMAVLKRCNERIDRVEKQVLKLSEEGELEVFDNGSAGI